MRESSPRPFLFLVLLLPSLSLMFAATAKKEINMFGQLRLGLCPDLLDLINTLILYASATRRADGLKSAR